MQEIIKHPQHHSGFKVNDIALLRLAERVGYTENIRPACLRSVIGDVDESQELWVVGWGATNAQSK